MESLGVCSVRPPANGTVGRLLPDTDCVVLGLQVCAGLPRAPRPVVEGGDSPRGPSEVLKTTLGS